MKHIKLYEGYQEDLLKISKDLISLEDKRMSIIEKMYNNITKLFKDFSVGSTMTTQGYIQKPIHIKIKRLDINSVTFDYLWMQKNDDIKIIKNNKTDYRLEELYRAARTQGNVFQLQLLAELYDDCITKYPEFFEGNAMGFFNVKESVPDKEEMRDRFTSLKVIEYYVKKMKDKNNDVWFDPRLKTSIGEIFLINFDGDRYYISYRSSIDNTAQSWDIYQRSDGFLDVVATALEENYPEIPEADSMGFFNVKEIKTYTITSEESVYHKKINIIFNYANKNDKMIFEPPLEIKIDNVYKKDYIKRLYKESNIIVIEFIDDTRSGALSRYGVTFLLDLYKLLSEMYPEALEGEAMGFFNTKGSKS